MSPLNVSVEEMNVLVHYKSASQGVGLDCVYVQDSSVWLVCSQKPLKTHFK